MSISGDVAKVWRISWVVFTEEKDWDHRTKSSGLRGLLGFLPIQYEKDSSPV
jgi:hypothetical protein